MATVSELQIVLKAVTDAFDRGLKHAKAGLDGFAKKANDVQNKMDKFARKHREAFDSMQTAGLAATAGLVALGAGVKSTVDEAIKFEASMAKVNKVMDFKTPEALQNMRSELEKLAQAGTTSFVELAQIAEAGGQLGVAEKDLIPFVSMVSDMATAFEMTAEVAGDSMAKIANVWNKPIQEMGQFGDMINLISNNTPAKASQIVEALGRVGGTAKAFGLSEQAAVGLTSAMIGLGKAPEVAATGLNSMLTTLSTLDVQDKVVSMSLKQLGLDAATFGNKLKKDGEAAIYDLLAAINKLPKDEQIGVVTDLFGKNFGDDILALATAPELMAKIRDLLADSSNYAGSMSKEAAVLSSTTEGKLKQLSNNVSVMKAAIGDAFLPMFAGLAEKITPIVQKITEWAKANPQLITTITAVTAVVLGVVAVLGGLALAFTAVSGGISAIIAIFGLLSAVITPIIVGIKAVALVVGFLAAPFAGVIAAIAAVIAIGVALYMHWDTVKAKASEVWDGVKAKLSEVWESIKSTISEAWENIKSTISEKIEAIKQFFVDWLASAPQPVQEMVANIVSVFTGLGKVWDFLVQATADAWSWIKVQLIGVIDFITEKWQGIKDKIGKVWDDVKERASQAWEQIKSVWNAVQPYFQAIWAGVKAYFTTAWQALTLPPKLAWETIKAVVKFGMDSIKAIIMTGVNIFATVFNTGFNLIKTVFKTAFAIIKGIVTGDMGAVKNAFSNGFNEAKAIVTGAVDKIWAEVKTLGSKLLQAGRDAVQGFINGIQEKIGQAVAKAREMAEQAWGAVKSALDINSPSKRFRKLGDSVGEGFEKGIERSGNKAVKQSKKMADEAAKATDDAIKDYQRKIALFGNNNPLAELDYDIKQGKYGGQNVEKLRQLAQESELLERTKAFSDELKNLQLERWKIGKSELEIYTEQVAQNDKLTDAQRQQLLQAKEMLGIEQTIAGIKNQIADIDKQMATHGLDSLQMLEWEIANTEKYKDVSAEILQDLKDKVKAQQDFNDELKKQANIQAGTKKADDAEYELSKLKAIRGDKYAGIRLDGVRDGYANADIERLVQVEKLKEQLNGVGALIDNITKKSAFSDTAITANLSSVGGGAQFASQYYNNHQRLETELQDAKTKLDEARAAELISQEEYEKQSEALTEQHLARKRTLMETASQSILGGLSNIAKLAFGEQSRAYKVMFAIEKAHAIARILLANKTALAQAWASAPFPANLAAVGKVLLESGAIVAAVNAIRPVGQAHDGIMSVPKSGTWNLEKGERVLPKHTAKALDAKLDSMGNGGNNINVSVTVNSDGGDVQANHDMGKRFGEMIKQAVQQQLLKERRQGHLLYG